MTPDQYDSNHSTISKVYHTTHERGGSRLNLSVWGRSAPSCLLCNEFNEDLSTACHLAMALPIEAIYLHGLMHLRAYILTRVSVIADAVAYG